MALFLPIWVLFSWISIVVVGGLVAFSRDDVARQIVGKRLLVGVGNWYVLFAEHYAVALDICTINERCMRMKRSAGRCCSMVFMFISDRMQVGESSV